MDRDHLSCTLVLSPQNLRIFGFTNMTVSLTIVSVKIHLYTSYPKSQSQSNPNLPLTLIKEIKIANDNMTATLYSLFPLRGHVMSH